MSLISLSRVKKSFNENIVLSDFSLSVKEGQRYVLLGSSGCGKTTILRLIAGLESPESGEILLGGRAVKSFSRKELSLQMGFMTQDGGLFPHLTAFENIKLPCLVQHLESKIFEKRMAQLCEMTGIKKELLEKYPHQLSGGERQRIALMRGIILLPPVMLLDEPLSALDPLVRAKIQREIKDIFQELDITSIIVTHNIQEASFLGSEIALLNSGEIIQKGVMKDLADSPKTMFVKDFINAQIPNIGINE